MRRRLLRAALVALAALLVAALVPGTRRAVLRGVGGLLIASDPVDAGDVVVISESGMASEFQAAELEASDLYQQRLFPRVMILTATRDRMDEELARRGVTLDNPVRSTLRQLGVPESALVTLEAGEGGTTESTRALAAWAQQHRARVLVLIGASHSRRYRRALLRVWPDGVPAPRVAFPKRTVFRRDDWWQSRRTLRDGLFELQKLAWDYVTHPW